MSTSIIYSADESHSLFTLSEVCRRCGIHAEIIIEMVEFGVVTPTTTQTDKNRWQFSTDTLLRLMRARRLHKDLELNLPGLALSLDLLDEIEALKQQVGSLQHQLQKLHNN